MPKIVDKPMMKKQIMEAALKAFLKYGFNNTTMNQIAQEANIAKGTLYLYFKSKELLILQITKQYFEQLSTQLIAKEPFETLDELLNHIKNSLSINEDDSKFIPIFFEAFGAQVSSESFMKDYNDFFEKIGLFYTKNFELLIQNNQINKNIHPDTLGRVFISMLDGIILHKGFFKIDEDKYTQMVDDAIGLFRGGLSNSKIT